MRRPAEQRWLESQLGWALCGPWLCPFSAAAGRLGPLGALQVRGQEGLVASLLAAPWGGVSVPAAFVCEGSSLGLIKMSHKAQCEVLLLL